MLHRYIQRNANTIREKYLQYQNLNKFSFAHENARFVFIISMLIGVLNFGFSINRNDFCYFIELLKISFADFA